MVAVYNRKPLNRDSTAISFILLAHLSRRLTGELIG